MAALFTPDTIEGAQLDISAGSGQIIRTGTITGIPSTGTNSDVLLAALTTPGVGTIASSPYPNTTLSLTRIFAVGFTADGLKVALYYNTFQSIIPSAYIIRDHSSMTSRTTTFDQFTQTLLSVSYDGSAAVDGDDGLDDPDPNAPADTGVTDIPQLKGILCPTETLQPLREISVTRVGPGHPSVPAVDTHGWVNNASWPGNPGSPQLQQDAFGNNIGLTSINNLWTTPAPVGNPLPPGYWLLNRCDTDYTMYQNYFTTEIGAISMVNQPWSQLLVARDPSTGLYCRPRADVLKGAITAAFANYTPGWLPFNNDGFGIYSPYPKIDFKTAFGF